MQVRGDLVNELDAQAAMCHEATRGRENLLPVMDKPWARVRRDPQAAFTSIPLPLIFTVSHFYFNTTVMDSEEDWNAFLRDHPIFSLPEDVSAARSKEELSFELSLNTLPNFTTADLSDDGPTPSGRRQVMVIKDSDIIVAAGSEIRMASLGDAKMSKSQRKSYKVCISSYFFCTGSVLILWVNETQIGSEYATRNI